MSKLTVLSEISWMQPFAGRKKYLNLWKPPNAVSNHCKFVDGQKRMLNIKFEEKFGINVTQEFRITSGREVFFPKNFRDRIKEIVFSNPDSFFIVTVVDAHKNEIEKGIIKIILPLKTKIETGKYGVIYIPKEYRNLFPEYQKDFLLKTEIGDFFPHVTARNKSFPSGSNIQGGLLPWFRNQTFSKNDSLVIEILKPGKEYFLSLLNQENQIDYIYEDNVISMTEGQRKVFISSRAERKPQLRKLAIEIHGLACKVCGFNFEEKYGKFADGFIEVHHMKPLSSNLKIDVVTNPRTDLTVLCSNCHRMVHRKRGITLTIDELKNKLK